MTANLIPSLSTFADSRDPAANDHPTAGEVASLVERWEAERADPTTDGWLDIESDLWCAVHRANPVPDEGERGVSFVIAGGRLLVALPRGCDVILEGEDTPRSVLIVDQTRVARLD